MKSHTKIFLFYHIGYLMVKYFSYTTTINKMDGYAEKSNGNKYLMLVPTDEIWNKIRDLIRSITNTSRL